MSLSTRRIYTRCLTMVVFIVLVTLPQFPLRAIHKVRAFEFN